MSDVAVSVENLGKRYRIGQTERYYTLRDTLAKAMTWPFRSLASAFNGGSASVNKRSSSTDGYIWALKDISFEIKRGEVVGFIGHNGAGKTTLLKILSRITEPTEGLAKVYGSVGSLLEVGTGFHPELTGRENIYLNGAILGLRKSDIDRLFDEIVDFSGVERFISTPVKRYSSGMQVRLAFAVAAYLEPEILLVDEVLAVGDAEFQRKCIRKMEGVAKEGRTVLFVSHNMGSITNLCSRALLLADGHVAADGPADEVTADYMQMVSSTAGGSYVCHEEPDSRAWIASADLKAADGRNKDTFLMTEPIVVDCTVRIAEKSTLTLSVQIKEMNNSPIYHFPNGDTPFVMPSSPGSYLIKVQIPPLNLYPGKYLSQLSLCDSTGAKFEILHVVEGVSFEILQDYSLAGRPLGRHAGLVFSRAEWSSDRPERPQAINNEF